MVFAWWRQHRRRKILSQPFPASWEHILQQNVRHVTLLNDAERAKLRRCVQVFVAEKYWEGCNGLEITDEIQVTIASQACLLLLGFEAEYFDRLLSVLVYPDTYFVRETVSGPGGTVIEGCWPRLGEAWFQGPIILSWAAVRADSRNPHESQNVVLHEFAHYFDMQDQVFNGTPVLTDAQQFQTWREVMTAEYNELIRSSSAGHPTLLDQYGASNEAEFFAVATECFFEQPVELSARHPRLYEILRSFYRQDPAQRRSQKGSVT